MKFTSHQTNYECIVRKGKNGESCSHGKADEM
jgi:hypothetical protein